MRKGQKRKLVTRKGIEELRSLLGIGVPLVRALENLQMDISRPVINSLLKMNDDPQLEPVVQPEWLVQDGPRVQQQPEGWYFDGYFPDGEWVYEEPARAEH